MGSTLSCASGKNCAGDSNAAAAGDRKKKQKEWKTKKKRKKFVDDVDRRRRDLDDVRSKSSELLPKLSQHDSELVEEHVRTTERKYGELQSKAEKKQRSYGTLGGSLGHVKAEAEQYIRWLDDTNSSITTELQLGCLPDDVDQQLHATKELSALLEEKQVTLDSVRQKAEALLDDLPGPERQAVELMVREVQAQHLQVVQLVTARCAKLEESRQLRQDFQTAVTKEHDWLDNRAKAADKLDSVRLLASDVEKQADKCKSLAAKVQRRGGQLQVLSNSGQQVKEDCTQEGSDQVDAKLAELTDQQKNLIERLKQQEEYLRNCAAARQLYEADTHKVEQWCHETDVKCSADLLSDCATEVLEEQVKQYKALANTAHIFESLVKETVERGEGFKSRLHDNDLPVLEQQLASLQDTFNRTSQLVSERLQSLESSLSARHQVQNTLETSTTWLENMQDQIKAAECPVGPSAENAQASLQQFEELEKSLAEYQPTIAALSSKVESLRAEGQLSQADDILRLTSQYELLIDKVASCRSNRQAAIAVRQQHESKMVEIQKALEDGQKEMESIANMGITVPERLEQYKELQEKMAALQSEISIAENHAQQVVVSCAQEDRATVLSPVETAKQQLSAFAAVLDARIGQCQRIQHDRDNFEVTMNETMQWLEEKEDILASFRPLHLDSDKVDPVMEKHKMVSEEAIQRLSTIRQKADVELEHFKELGEQVPEQFSQKVQEIDVLQTSIQEAIVKKEQYLQEAKGDRKQLETSMRQVSDWLRGAEELLDSGIDGLDCSSIDQTLSEFTDYFSEASLCQDEMDQVTELSDKLMNTLDSNDTETLQQSLARVNKRLAHVTAASHKKQQLLETKTAQWHSFQDGIQELSETLEQRETEWTAVDCGTLTSPQELNVQLQKVKAFNAKLEESQPTVGTVNDTARSLLRTANSGSASSINQLMLTLNQRWEGLVSQAEGKQAALEELQGQWQQFSSSLRGAEDVIHFCQDSMSTITVPSDTQAELVEQLDVIKNVNDELLSVAPQVERLRSSSAALQKALPSAEAKVTLQERFIVLLEAYERLQGSVSEQLSQTQEEVDDRDNFLSEVTQTLTWLTDTKQGLQGMNVEAEDAFEQVDKCKVYQQEISVRMEQMRRLAILQETKYAALGRDLPHEMRQQLQQMHSLEQEVSVALREKMEELIHLREDREEYQATLAIVSQWLKNADQQLQERIVSIPPARLAHQTLLSQFEEFKQSLDRLRNKGGDIIRHSSDQAEKQEVQKTIASVNRQWLSLQASTADRTQELSEAADLAHAVDDVAQSVETWVEQAEGVVGTDLNWSDFDSVREQLKSHKRLTKDLDQNEDKLVALNAMVKQLDQVCDTSNSMAALGALRERVSHVGREGHNRLGLLEDANRKIDDYEKEIGDLRRWMEETRTHISMRDTTRDLKEQLAVQERLLEDIKSNKARTEVVLEEHATLRDRSGETTPSQGHRLLKEIGHLEETAEFQRAELQAAVSEQEQYETEIRHLNAAISEAQQQLLASPVRASTVEALKQQIAERDQELSATSDEPRARSSSFGQKVEPLGRPLGSGPPVEELNQSWTTLQKQVAAKEKELQQALQKQERYQQAVQELTAKMERAQISLTRTPASVAASVDTQMSDYKDTLLELDSIREDISLVRERGRQMMEMSDAEGSKAMEATLTMLGDRITNLQSLADHKGKQLQDIAKHKKKHDIALAAYKKRITDLESWLGEMKIRHASMPLPIDSPADIQQQLQENRDLQEELNSRLQLMSDLAVQCDNLCELEPPKEAEKLRNQLSSLHTQLGEFKLLVVEKQTSMRAALKDSEKRHKEMGDYEDRVGKLQQWMTETKQMTMPAQSTPLTVRRADHSQLQQDLASDLSKHQQLVRQLAVTQPKGQKVPASSATESRVATVPTISEAELHAGWQTLQKELESKTQQLENILQKRKAGETVKLPSGSVGDTSQQLHDIQSLVAQLSLCWQQLQVQVQDKQLRLETALSFQQQMQSALTAMSAWLDTAEQIVLTPSTGAQSEHDRIRQNEALQRELRGLQSEITVIGTQAQYLLSQSSGQSHGLIQESLTNLNQRVGILEKHAVERSEELRHAQHQWQQYHDDVRSLRTRMQELQTSVVGPPTTSTATLDSLVTNINKLETALKKCETQLDELKGREKELSIQHPRGVMPSELGSLRTSYMDLQRKLVERKAGLMQSVSVQEQYQNMLKDYADFLETAEGKLKTEAISARDLPHLKQQLNAHKEFFSDLEVHKAMLDSLASQCDPATQDAHSMQHTRLRNLTHMLVDQASLHGQRLERLMRQWIHLADKLEHLHQFLAQVEEEIPKPIASGDSLSTIQEKLGKFKRLQGQLADERPTVFQAVDQGKQLLHIVACPALETGVTELADKWVELNTQLVHELKKTETIGEQLQIFEAEAMVLKTWMSTAKLKLDDLKHLSEEDMQNIGNIRTKVEHILEFRKEVQNQLPLKSKVMSVGRQLIANRNYDTRGLDARLDAIEEEWANLEQSINTAEQTLHQAQMELMPSRQALHELQVWMEEMEKALAADAKNPIKSLADIEVMLKTYKGYKVELASKQLTMDFVNQSVLQPGAHDIGVDTEKLDYAEKLNELNRHWKKVSTDINERLRSLEQLSGKWAEYEVALAQLQSWFQQQEEKIKRYRLIGHEVGVKQTLKDCKAMQDQLQARKEDMDSVKLLGQSLIELSRESPGCQHSVRESLSALSKQWEQLQQQMMQLESLLSDMLGQWARYHADLQSLNQVLNQTEYTLNRYSLVGADMQTLLSQVDKLKSLEQDLKQHSSHLDSFSTLATQLCQVCEPPVQAEVQSTVIDMKTKWNKLSADLSTRRAQFERCLAKWKEYEEEYEKISEWLTQKEAECSDLVTMRDDVAARHECLEKSLALQQELDGIQPQLSALYSLSDDLTKNMGTSTIVLLTSRQSAIEQRLLALRQLLSQHIHGLNEDLSQVNRFREAFATVKKFLEHAESVLSTEDPNKTAEQIDLQNRLVQLKELLTQFQANFGKLDEVNDLGYRLALASSDSSQLLELNHQWHNLRADCQERSKALQAHLLMQQDFTAKCQSWMDFLANTERYLATKIAGNLTDLLEQQRKCQDFEGEMYSHQQVLHAIISDGQKMMRAGEVEDPKEFEEKLRLLKEQWQSVTRRANQRKTIIDDTIQDWHLFNSLVSQLQTWLAEKRENLKMFDVDKLSLQQIRNLLDKVKTIQSEFRMQEESFRKVHDLGATLLERADGPASQEIKVATAQLQNGWLEVYNQLEEHRVKLEALQRDWHECEDDIEEILTWLKSIRQMLNADIPDTYDGLQADLTRCRDISASFDNSEDKRQALLARERKLGRSIQAEDMNVLHQRIRLLNKQWDELKSQANLRDHRVQDSTFRWSSLGEHIRALLEWIEDMEVKIMSSRDIHVEDLLNKLETEYEDAMALKGREVEEVVAQGEQLMKNSSDVRASDIGQRLKHLKDQWNHLIGVAEFRKRKLQETVLAVKQLDSSMRNLTHWLSSVEQELTSQIVYRDWDMEEIHSKLQHTQDIQRDIEQHSAGVSSVLNLCEVLLHDTDACPTGAEFDALQHAMKNLERRWKNICELCPERRAKIKETWDLWEIFRTDCGRFSDWLGEMESEVGESEAIMPASVTKEDIRKYETLQRKVHDHLTDLEAINKQYRRLAKEGRTDTKGVLRSTMQEANDRWDALQQRVTAMMQGLRQSASIREDFLTTHLNLMQWLTEVDIQITNIEHLSQLDTPTKIKELQRIEEEIDDRRHRMDYLNQAAVLLIQQGTEEEAVRVQMELDEFKVFSRQVFDRVANCRANLLRLSATQGDQTDMPSSTEWDSKELEVYLKISPPESPSYKRRAGVGGTTILPRASVSPMRRSASPIRSASPSRRSPSPTWRSVSPTRRSGSPSRWRQDVTDSAVDSEARARGRNAKIDVLLEQLADALDAATAHLDVTERMMELHTSIDGTLSHKELQTMLECETRVDTVLRLDRLLKIEAGTTPMPTVDAQVTSVTERWERLQSRATERDVRITQQQRDLSKFSSDVENLLTWLDEAEALQASHDTMPSDIAHLNVVIRQHKDFMVQLEAKRAHFLSIQLLSKNYINLQTPEGLQLQSRVRELEQRWESVTTRASETQRRLQGALLQCQEFHHTVQDYLLWLEGVESRVRHYEPVRLSAEPSLLWDKYNMLRELRSELEENQPAVMSLRETADQLLASGELPEMAAARDKTHIISNRLRSLIHLTNAYIQSLETKLGITSSSVDAREGRLPTAVHPTLRTRTRSPFALLRKLNYRS